MPGVKLQTAVADNVVCLEHQGVFDVGVIDKLPHGREKAFYVFINTVTDAGGVNADVGHVILLSQFADGLCLGAEVHSAPLVTLKDAELTAGHRRRGNDYAASAVTVLGTFRRVIADPDFAPAERTQGQRLKVFPDFPAVHHAGLQVSQWENGGEIVDELAHQQVLVLGLGVGSTIAGTTDTTTKEREPTDPTVMADVEYKCEQTNFDTVLTYAKLDLWAKFQDFQVRIRNAIVKRQALDRIMIGFNGVKRAKTSDRNANPMLQDVNKGWLQKIREDAPDHVMGSETKDGVTTKGAVKVGKGGDYANLDAVVMDAVNELIDPVYQDDDDLVVVCGRELLSDKYFPLVNKDQENTEKLAADLIISQKRMGGLQAVRAPYFPANALLITRLDNLSIYWQEDTRRRSVIDNPKRDRIENFESVNEAYVVEDYRCAALVENIQMGDFSAPAVPEGEGA